MDNDLFFRIGLLNLKPNSNTTGPLVEQIQNRLSETWPPVITCVTLHDVFVAAYEDDKLPLPSTQVWSVADERVTGEFVAELYR